VSDQHTCRVAEETFARRADAQQFAFLWEGELVTGFYDAATRRCHLITDHDELTLAGIHAWLMQFLPGVFDKDDEEESRV
jgi:hypothetical protein